jgi:beta-fructofuranosidase
MSWNDRAFFAPESVVDDRGRRIMWAWIFDGREPETQQASGWSGTMSLPRVLWLGGDGTLRMTVPEELALLRYNPRGYEDLIVAADGELALEGVQGRRLELRMQMTSEEASQFGLKVCCSPDEEEYTLVFYDALEKELRIDTRQASVGEGSKSVEGGPFALGEEETLTLRVFVDNSVVEAFANDRQAVMRRIYPTREDSVGVRLFSRGGASHVRLVEAWDMAPANAW